MSIVSEINRINTNIANAYAKCEEKGATMPLEENSNNLASTIDSITGGGSGGLDWSAIGYSGTPEEISTAYNHAKEIYDNWNSSITSMNLKFDSDKDLIIMPLVDTSNVTTTKSCFNKCYSLLQCPLLNTKNVTEMRGMFSQCNAIREIPQFNTSKVTTMQSMFANCLNLSDTSLNNILKMCINTNSNYSRTKSLTDLGFINTNYSASRIQALPSYQDFINAGWTIGY